MQKKIARFLIDPDVKQAVAQKLSMLPGPVMDVQYFTKLAGGHSNIAVYAEMALNEDKDANVERSFHVYQSGAIIADGHIHVASTRSPDGAVYHLYENVGAVPENVGAVPENVGALPENNRIVKLGPVEGTPPVVAMLNKYEEALFSINVIDCREGVMLLEGARAPIQGVISVLNMYNGLYGHEIAHVVEEVVQTGSTRYVSHLDGKARVRTDIRVVTKTEQMIEKAAMEKAEPAKEHLYTMTITELDSGQVISQDVKLVKESMTAMLRMLCQVPVEDMVLFFKHIHQYNHGIAISRDDSMKKYKVEVTGVEEMK